MKLLAIVGTNASFSYNRFLAQFIAKHYSDQAEIEVKEIDQLTPFCRTQMADDSIKQWIEEVKSADGIIITTPEYNHTIPAALKSSLEWLGSHAGPNVMKMKPVAVLGTSKGTQGSSRAQEDMREILLTPDMGANVLPSNEVLIGNAPDKFDEESGDLTDETTIGQIDAMMDNFFKFVKQATK